AESDEAGVADRELARHPVDDVERERRENVACCNEQQVADRAVVDDALELEIEREQDRDDPQTDGQSPKPHSRAVLLYLMTRRYGGSSRFGFRSAAGGGVSCEAPSEAVCVLWLSSFGFVGLTLTMRSRTPTAPSGFGFSLSFARAGRFAAFASFA